MRAQNKKKHRNQGGKTVTRPMLLAYDHPAAVNGSTVHKGMVQAPGFADMVLKYGFENAKLGSIVTKGRLKGAKLYYLTLEERATCPKSCILWRSCYGNNMPFAHRWHASPSLIVNLDYELNKLCTTNKIVLIRLHVLGDFYSPEYVEQWGMWLKRYDNLHVFGYTARNDENDPIAKKIALVRARFGMRFAIRNSNADQRYWATETVEMPSQATKRAFVCPEQTGKTECCATCGACWATDKNVAFMRH
jgi:hypothetical protein